MTWKERANLLLLRGLRKVYSFCYMKMFHKIMNIDFPYRNEKLPANLIRYLAKRYTTIFIRTSLRFVIYVYTGEKIILDAKHLAEYATSIHECEDICKSRKEKRFLVLEFTKESIVHQYVIRKSSSGSVNTTKLA